MYGERSNRGDPHGVSIVTCDHELSETESGPSIQGLREPVRISVGPADGVFGPSSQKAGRQRPGRRARFAALARVLALAVCQAALVLPPAAHASRDERAVAGEWDSDWGWVVLEASPIEGTRALAVTGYWIQDTEKKGLIPSGTFDPATRTLEFALVQSWNKKRGTATFVLSADGRTFKGTWQYGDGQGEWLLRRVRGDTFEAKVDSLVAYAGVRADGPGGAVMVVEDGKVLLAKGYGYAHVASRKPNTGQTSFELASVAKQFTAAAIMILRDQGELAFRDDVRQYIPELPVYRPRHPILISHLLHHTSGLPQYGDLDVPQVKGRKPPFVCNEDFAPEFARAEKVPPPFRARRPRRLQQWRVCAFGPDRRARSRASRSARFCATRFSSPSA